MKKYATAGLVVFAVALLVRVLYVVSIKDTTWFTHLQTEPQHYDEWARAILDGRAPVHLPFDEAPAYPYFVALIYALTGGSTLAVVLVQALFGAAACSAIALVARRLGGERAAWIAGGIASIFGPFIYFTGQLEPAALAVAAVAGALVLTPAGTANAPADVRASAGTPASLRRWLVAGLAWAIAIVVRSEMLVAAGVIVVHAALAGGRKAALRAAAAPAALVVVALAANTIASGHPVLLTTGAGVNLWLGNNPDADGVNPFIHGPLERVVAEVETATPDAVERDHLFRMHAELDAGLLAKKLLWTFSRRELPNAADIPWQTQQSWVFQPPAFPLGFALVFPLALAGAFAARERRRDLVMLLAPIAAALAACVVFFTNARFRLPMMPPLIILVALAFSATRDRKELMRRAVGAVLGIAIAWPSYFGLAHFRVAQIDFNTASLEHRVGHLDRAAAYLRSGLERDPQDIAGWAELAAVLHAKGDDDGARAALARAAELKRK